MRMTSLLLAALLAASCVREAASPVNPSTPTPESASAAGPSAQQEPLVRPSGQKGKRAVDFHFEDPTKVSDADLAQFYVTMKVAVDGAEAGTIAFAMWPEKAPKSVRNFLRYCDEGFYDGLVFHRIMREFMIQGGSPTNDGGGSGPNGRVVSEFSIDPQWNHRYGVLSMARGGDPDSASSQFFLCCEESPSTAGLNGKYSSFGRMVAGVAALEAVANVPVGKNPMNGEASRPLKRAIILEARAVKGPLPASSEVIARPASATGALNLVVVQHLLIGFQGGPAGGTRSKEDAAAFATELLARARKGEDFSALIKAYSDDHVDPKAPQPGVYRITAVGHPDRMIYEGIVQRQSMMATVLKETEAKYRAGEVKAQQWLAELQKQEAKQGIMTFMQSMVSFPRNELVAAFGDVGYALEVGEYGMATYDPKTSPFGCHVIKRLE